MATEALVGSSSPSCSSSSSSSSSSEANGLSAFSTSSSSSSLEIGVLVSPPSGLQVGGDAFRPKVLMIITGGTVCMQFRGSYLAPTPLAERLVKAIPELQEDPDSPLVDIIEWPSLVDSSDIGLDEWIRVAEQIQKYYTQYEGFVVLQGTDTLAYTSSALSFMLEDLSKTVVVTGSMLPLANLQTDARRNIAVSVMVAGYSQLGEVCVVFGSKIMRGTRARKTDCSQMDAFDSPNFPPLGRVGVEVILDDRITNVLSSVLSRKNSMSSLSPQPLHATTTPASLKVFRNMCLQVVTLTVIPGMSVTLLRQVLSLPTRPFAVVLELYGSGTAPRELSFSEVIQFGIDNGVTIMATTQCSTGTANMLQYENGARLAAMGVINGRDITPEACVTKLAFLMGKGYKGHSLKKLMETNLKGEMTQTPRHVKARRCSVDGTLSSSH